MKFLISKKKVIAGVSGGPDSMCMLDVYKANIGLVCHVNYNKRPTAIRDQEIVVNYCKNNNIPLEILNVQKIEYQNMHNFQSLGRKIRYDFFYSMGKKYDLNEVYIAHNFNDFLETSYMQKSRSKNLLFYGIKKKSNYKDLKVFRPLLFLQRSWIENYCKINNIIFGIDESNQELIYERNKVRVILSKWSKDSIFEYKQEILKHNAKYQKMRKLIDRSFIKFKESEFAISSIENLSELIRYHLFYKYLSEFNIKSTDSKIKAIIDFINLKSQKKYRLKDNLFLQLINGKLKIIKE